MTGRVIEEMIRFFGTDIKRIAHALKVFAYAEALTELENIARGEREITLIAAILHDVGIKIAEQAHGSCTAREQEELGPAAAGAILERLGVSAGVIDRVCFLIAHHHSPETTEDIDFRILLEADYIVNFEEGWLPLSSLSITAGKHFRTKSGLGLLQTMFPETIL
jgi:predicted metal-dependent HD superfamily phosphohydrolase